MMFPQASRNTRVADFLNIHWIAPVLDVIPTWAYGCLCVRDWLSRFGNGWYGPGSFATRQESGQYPRDYRSSRLGKSPSAAVA